MNDKENQALEKEYKKKQDREAELHLENIKYSGRITIVIGVIILVLLLIGVLN